MNKETRKAVKRLKKKYGCHSEVQGNGHIRLSLNDGRYIVLSATPKKFRAATIASDVKRVFDGDPNDATLPRIKPKERSA